MKKYILLVLLLAVMVLGTYVGVREFTYPKVLPNVETMDTTRFPHESGWIAPGKSWVSDYRAGDVRVQAVLLSTPKFYSTSKMVVTENNDTGILEQKLFVPPLNGNLEDSQLSLVSENVRDQLQIKSYEPASSTLIISGFEPIKKERVVTFTYVPEYFTHAVYPAKAMGTDSQKELMERWYFEAVDESVLEWITVSCDGKCSNDYILVNSPPMTAKEISVTIGIPEWVVLPSQWEFRVGTTDVTGRDAIKGITLLAEMNYKFLVSDENLKLSDEYTKG